LGTKEPYFKVIKKKKDLKMIPANKRPEWEQVLPAGIAP